MEKTIESTMSDIDALALSKYAQDLQKNLDTQKEMKNLLEMKITMLEQNLKHYNVEFTKDSTIVPLNGRVIDLPYIDMKITVIKTRGELNVLNKIIEEKEKYYAGWLEQFKKDVADCNLRYKHTLSIAQKSTKPVVQRLLQNVVWPRIEESIEHKIALYKQLRKHV